MAGGRSDPTVRVRSGSTASLRRIGKLCTATGLTLGTASLCVVLLGLPFVAADSALATAVRIGGLLSGHPAALSGAALAVYVGVVGVLAACWVLGAGLLIDGLFDESAGPR